MEALKGRVKKLEKELEAREVLRAAAQQQLLDMEAQIELLTREAELLEKVEQTLLHISTKVLGQSTKTIDRLLTVGLRLVFEDQNLEFRTTVERFRGKTAIHFDLYQDGQTAPLLNAYGGGVLVVAGVLLRVVTITTLGMRRLLILDETLSHLSAEYHTNASMLLKKLCDDLAFDVLLVTHQPAFAEFADFHYEAVESRSGTVFRRRDGGDRVANTREERA